MDLFKNEVGRPSNETLKKRRNFKIFISVFAVVAVLLAGFGVYKVFAPSKIEGEGLNANVSSDNKFVFEEKSGYQSIEACHKVIAPKDAKNWRVEVKYKESGKITWKSMIKRDHYNDGVKYDNICFNQFNSKGTYRVLVKWTKGKNNLTYSSPNKWKPEGWKTNLLTGWAYKDFSSKNNSKVELKVIGLSEKVYDKLPYTERFEVSHNASTKLYFILEWCGLDDCGLGERYACTPLESGETFIQTFTHSFANSWIYSSTYTYKLYSTETCDEASLLDSKSIKTRYIGPVYKYENGEWVLSE